MRQYEIMYIVKSTLDESEFLNVVETTNKIITDNQGVVESVDNWGLKDFAYQIKDMKKGYYVVLRVKADVKAIAEFDRLTRINKSIVRFLVTKVEE